MGKNKIIKFGLLSFSILIMLTACANIKKITQALINLQKLEFKLDNINNFKLNNINLRCNKFEFCPEVTAKVRKKGYKIHEVPIRYYPRTKQEGKKIGWKDGAEAIWTLLKYRFID